MVTLHLIGCPFLRDLSPCECEMTASPGPDLALRVADGGGSYTQSPPTPQSQDAERPGYRPEWARPL